MKKTKRTWATLLLITVTAGCCSCSRVIEPEQVYLISAMGFDGAEDGVRVTVEIPVIGEAESAQQKTIRFSQTGEDVRGALRRMEAGLSKELIFSHCALALLGDSLTKEQMQQIFEFAGTGEGIPLAAEAVTCDNAENLLGVSGISGIAMGYELHQILERERHRTGAEMPCGIYELRGMTSPDAPVALPRFEVAENDGEEAARLVGMDVLRPHGEPIRLTREECVSYAVLTDTYGESQNDGIRRSHVKNELTYSQDGGEVRLTLLLKMDATGRSVPDPQAEADALCRRTEALFQRGMTEAGEDLFGLSARIGADLPSGAVLTVLCEVRVRG